MAGIIVLTRSTRHNVEKLSFDQEGGSWRVVLERPWADGRLRRGEQVKTYASAAGAWQDIEAFITQGYKLVLFTE